MATKVYRYRRRGVTAGEVATNVGTTPVAVGLLMPFAYQDITIDENAKVGLDEYMALVGWEYIETDPPASGAKSISQIQPAVLGSDASSVPVASGWTDVSGLSVNLTTKGNTEILVVCSVLAGVLVGGGCRVLINGGSFSDAIIGPDTADFPVLSTAAFGGFTTAASIPSTETATTYTIRVQVRGVGILSSVTPRKGSSLLVSEYK